MPLRMLFAMVAVSATTLQSVVALGACHTTLRGELVPHSRPQDPRVRVVPQKLLFFSLDEIRRDSGQPVATAFELAVHSSGWAEISPDKPEFLKVIVHPPTF